MEGKIPTNAVDFPGTVGRSISTIKSLLKLLFGLTYQERSSKTPTVVALSILLRSVVLNTWNAAQNTLRAFLASADQNVSSQSGSYHYVNAPQVSYHEMNPQQSPYQINPQHSPYKLNPQHSPYRINPQHSPYQVNASYSPY